MVLNVQQRGELICHNQIWQLKLRGHSSVLGYMFNERIDKYPCLNTTWANTCDPASRFVPAYRLRHMMKLSADNSNNYCCACVVKPVTFTFLFQHPFVAIQLNMSHVSPTVLFPLPGMSDLLLSRCSGNANAMTLAEPFCDLFTKLGKTTQNELLRKGAKTEKCALTERVRRCRL